jgi:hypothetical protein
MNATTREVVSGGVLEEPQGIPVAVTMEQRANFAIEVEFK